MFPKTETNLFSYAQYTELIIEKRLVFYENQLAREMNTGLYACVCP